ncbi:uncharacterized protein TA18640 [Theileria annulata]|uniref:Uncharacterized protein n=1 Tax=Theileria annulata TaxID=5874 RepID=Q4UBG0_THEAN|nr:uncharacterized protein TA18640 [Theileria annulata]CAI75841.1 hypothetical protein TA18640 [Theileria annulata]|eukprot:XP_955317.1 hypothetical protein TA18640 [Theileria annulata]
MGTLLIKMKIVSLQKLSSTSLSLMVVAPQLMPASKSPAKVRVSIVLPHIHCLVASLEPSAVSVLVYDSYEFHYKTPLMVCAEIESATLSTTVSSKTLALTLKTDGATIIVEGDAEGVGTSNGQHTLASGGTLRITNITLSGEDTPYSLTSIGSLTATSLKLKTDSVTIKRDTLITLKLTVDSTAQINDGNSSRKLKGPQFPFSLGAYKVTSDVPLNTSTSQSASINTNPDTNSELHSQHAATKCCIWGKQYEWTHNPMV